MLTVAVNKSKVKVKQSNVNKVGELQLIKLINVEPSLMKNLISCCVIMTVTASLSVSLKLKHTSHKHSCYKSSKFTDSALCSLSMAGFPEN